MATDAKSAGSLQGHFIFRVTGFDILSLKDYRFKDPAEETYIRILKSNVRAAELYFSQTWDLTNAYQRQSGPSEYVWTKADERFFWNKYVSQDLIDAASIQPLVGHFIMPVIYGYVNLIQTTINNQLVTFGLITRRNRWRSGTRYFRRGIDHNGNVANFNETEQILCVPTPNDSDLEVSVFSYIQTRGSIPVHWAEVNNLRYRPKLKVGGSAIVSAKKHFDEHTQIYGKAYLVNLVNQKGYELPVKSAYEKVVEDLGDPNLKYVYFDFHHECSKMRWHRVQILIDNLASMGMDQQGWYQAKVGTEKSVVEKLQKSVVRTNCMDCLDRTNVVQSQLARWILQQQLEEAEVLYSGQRWDQDKSFELSFCNMWADNADAISNSYSGTGALKTDFTRLGKRTKLGAISDLRNSISRYFKNNLADGPRQDGFDLFLGNHFPYETPESPFTDSRPIFYQSIPYFFVGSFIMLLAAILFPRGDTPRLLNFCILIFWISVFVYSLKFILDHGLQYVNWPKLVELDFVHKVPVSQTKNGGSKKSLWVMSEGSNPEQNARGLEEGKRE